MRIDEAIMSYSTDNPSADVNQLIDFVQEQVCVQVHVQFLIAMYLQYPQKVGKGRQFVLSPFSLTVVVIWA